MKKYFDEETDRRLLEAKSEEEVRAIIASTPEAEKLADKIDLVMSEIGRIKNKTDEELDSEELDNVAGGSKVKVINLSETQDCAATFFLEDLVNDHGASAYCTSNDQCFVSNEYEYHNTQFSNCKQGGKHEWERSQGNAFGGPSYGCKKCGFWMVAAFSYYHFFD